MTEGPRNTIGNVDGLITLLGATVFHFIVGIKIMWGVVTPYVTSYLKQFDDEVSYHHTLHVYTAIFLGQSLFMYTGGLIVKKLGTRLTAYIGATLISGCTYLSSYCTGLRGLIMLQGFVGAGIGIAYSAPIICAFAHFKENKGVVTGIITTGTGCGPFLAGIVASVYANRMNTPVDPQTNLYDPDSDVVQRVPGMFRALGLLYAVIGFVGASILMDPPKEEAIKSLLLNESGEHASLNKNKISVYDEAMLEQDSAPETKRQPRRRHQRYGSRTKFSQTYEFETTDMIRDSLCWLVIAAAVFTGVSGFYVAATFKTFGGSYINDDHYLTVIGSLGCLLSGVSRLFWGWCSDKIGHFETLEVSAYISPVVMLIYTVFAGRKFVFGLCVISLFGLWGASYCLTPTICCFLFGESNMGTNYGFIFFAFGVSCTILIDSAGFTEFNFKVLNYFFVCVGLVGALLCSHLRFLTSSIVDEKVLKHHRNTSSVSSMF